MELYLKWHVLLWLFGVCSCGLGTGPVPTPTLLPLTTGTLSSTGPSPWNHQKHPEKETAEPRIKPNFSGSKTPWIMYFLCFSLEPPALLSIRETDKIRTTGASQKLVKRPTWILCLPTLPPESGPWCPNEMQSCFPLKRSSFYLYFRWDTSDVVPASGVAWH